MKLKHLFLAAVMMLPMAASAVPAYPGIITRTNPDGTTVELKVYGDEFFSYVTDTENVIMEQNAEGYWKPVMLDGVKMIANPDVIDAMMQGSGAQKMRQKVEMQRTAALDSDGQTTYPTIGDDIHSLVVLMEYSDTKFTIENPKEAFSNWLNQENYSEGDAVGSVRDYYIATSHGQFKPIFDVEGVVPLPETSSYYTAYNKYGKFYKALEFAVAYLDPTVDFSKYDYDEDGVIDTIYFIYAGFGQADTLDETTIWPHQSTMKQYGITLDGKTFGPYATSNELTGLCYNKPEKKIDGIGTFVHEYGHVLGLPDLYDPNYRDNAITPGDWSTMCGGCYNENKTCPPLFSAYEKWLCKWLEPEYIVDNTEYELLSSDQENRAIKVPVYRRDGVSENKKEFFLLESRRRAAWDIGMKDQGMLIWHIDFNNMYWTSNSVNSTPAHPRCYLVSADGSSNPFTSNFGEAKGATWPGSRANNTFITPETEVTLDLYTSGSVNDHYFTSIAFDAENGKSTFKYNVVTEAPDITTVMRTPNSLLNGRGREVNNIRLYWDEAEGASTYYLTVYREKEDGTKLYLAGCNELNVGNVTTYDIEDIAKYLWEEEFKAYVRVCKELPSSETSNIITFVPANLTRISSIGDIVVDENAPVEYFNLQGVRVANPENGLYIRRQGNKVEKVFLNK